MSNNYDLDNLLFLKGLYKDVSFEEGIRPEFINHNNLIEVMTPERYTIFLTFAYAFSKKRSIKKLKVLFRTNCELSLFFEDKISINGYSVLRLVFVKRNHVNDIEIMFQILVSKNFKPININEYINVETVQSLDNKEHLDEHEYHLGIGC